MNEILYLSGDATLPMDRGAGIVAHVCNDIGGWGKGFVVPLGQRYPKARTQYREWCTRKTDPPFELGQVQFVEVAPELWVANMIGQQGLFRRGSVPPVRYEAIRDCLRQVCMFAQEHHAYVQMPRIGCGLAGGRWEEVRSIIEEELVVNDVRVMVIDLLEA